MTHPRPENSESDREGRTRVQTSTPQTLEFSNDTTNPTFGLPLPGGGVAGFPFLSPPLAADEIGRLGDYRILKKLGEGGMGFVFRAEDPVLKRFVALKVMRPEVAAKPQAAERFLREGRAAAGLKSDHIITIYSVGEANGVPFLAMEFLEGLPLDAWIKAQKKAVPLTHALRVVRDTLRGLATAHDKGLIHRDIKPANLWLEKGTSRIKLLDFGLTRGNQGDEQLTQEGAVVGTPAYMAPEQAGGKPVDPRADLFSVGTVMYQLLAGKNPFTRSSVMETLGAIGYEVAPPVASVRPDVPKQYSDFLDRLLAKKPEGRPANAKAALAELAAIEKQLQENTQATSAAVGVPFVAVPLVESTPQVWDEITEQDDAPIRTRAVVPPKPPSSKKLLLGGGLFALFVVLGGIIILITNKDGSKTKIEVPDDGTKVEIQKGGKTVASVGGKKATPPAAGRHGLTFDKGNTAVATKVPYRPTTLVTLEAWLTYQGEHPDQRANIVACPNGDLSYSRKGLRFYTFHGHVEPATVLPVGRRVHVAAVNDGAKRYLFLDGKRVGASTDAGGPFPENELAAMNAQDLYRIALGAGEFQGTFHAVRISTVGRYDKDFTPPAEFAKDKDTFALYKFDEGAGDTLKDSSGNGYHAKITGATWAAPNPTMDADRKAAEFVLANGGSVQIGDREYGPNEAAALPVEPFKIVRIYLPARELTDAEADLVMAPDAMNSISINYPLTDANLVRLAKQPAAKMLNDFEVNATVLTDGSLKRFRDFPQLASLFCNNFTGTGAGLKDWDGWGVKQLRLHGLTDRFQDDNLKHLGKLPNLSDLTVAGNGLTDGGVRHIAELSTLSVLNLNAERLTDAGLQPLRKLSTLARLTLLNSTEKRGRLTAAALDAVCGIPNLGELYLVNIPLRDADTKPLLGMAKLRIAGFYLPGEFGDAGLLSLAAIKTLNWVGVIEGRVTADGVKKFQAARPNVELGGQLPALADPDRAAALFVIGKGGSVSLSDNRGFNDVKNLPAEPFKLGGIYAARDAAYSDADLEQFHNLTDLVFLHFHGPITDAGIAKLAASPVAATLSQLVVNSPELTDAAFASIPKFKSLNRLQLEFSLKVTGSGLIHLKGLPVQFLRLGHATLTDAELAKLKDLPNLTTLDLTGTPITDAGLKHVGGLKQLTSLSLNNVQTVTDAGANHLEGLTELVTLHADAVPFGDAGCASLAKLPKLKSVQAAFMPNVTNAGMKALAKSPSLELAILARSPLTDTGLAALAACKTLKHLWVGGTKVTAAGVAAFRKARPDVMLTSDFDVDADRAAAEFVIGKGGIVQVPDNVGYVTEIAKLPAGPFKIIAVELGQRPVITDDDLDRFRNLASLEYLSVNGPITDDGLKKLATFPSAKKLGALLFRQASITDGGLKSLREFPELTALTLREVKNVTGTGLAHLKGSKVVGLNLAESGLTDAGLAALKEAGLELTTFSIIGTGVTDAGLKHLGEMKLTGGLQLQQCANVTDAGIRHLEKLTALAQLEYANFCPKITPASLSAVAKMVGLKALSTQFEATVTDDHLKPLAGMKNLANLLFASGNTTVTDAGLMSLGKLPALKILYLLGDKVTAEGAKAFHRARPDVQLTTSHGTIEAVDADRAAAEWVVSLSGRVQVDIVPGQYFANAAELPKGAFRLTGVIIHNNEFGRAGLARFKECSHLQHLDLSSSAITDDELANFKNSPNLTSLSVGSDRITDKGLVHFHGCKKLNYLNLGHTKITARGLKDFPDVGQLEHLVLVTSSISDELAESIGRFTALKVLTVKQSKVTAAGVKKLAAALPNCKIESDFDK